MLMPSSVSSTEGTPAVDMSSSSAIIAFNAVIMLDLKCIPLQASTCACAGQRWGPALRSRDGVCVLGEGLRSCSRAG